MGFFNNLKNIKDSASENKKMQNYVKKRKKPLLMIYML